MKPAGVGKYLLLVVSCGLLVYFLWYHYQLGVTRYFDADEFAHLHWAAKMLQGKRPYVDFQSFFPPGYAISLMPAFIGGWGTVQPFVTARIFTFLIFILMCLFSGLIFWELRRSLWGAVLAAVLLAFLPLPFDKYLEIRPDNLSTVLLLAAVYFQIKKKSFLSGVLYSLSYFVLPKMVPNIAIGFLYALFSKKPLKFIIGLAIPFILFGLWALTLGDPGLVWYSLFKLPVEANKISKYFIMMQDLFFNPNGIYYGADGWNRALLTNHVLWVTGLLVGAWRLVKPPKSADLLVALQFWVQMIFFVMIFPLKHAQYLIPIGVFVAWYCADIITVIQRRAHIVIFLPVYLLLCLFLIIIFREGSNPKLAWTNTDMLEKTSSYFKQIPPNIPVLDLMGNMLYNPDAYYACCIPFGQSAEFLSRPLPDLPVLLERDRVKFINQGTLKRVGTLPWPWQEYIRAQYDPMDGDDTMLVRKLH